MIALIAVAVAAVRRPTACSFFHSCFSMRGIYGVATEKA